MRFNPNIDGSKTPKELLGEFYKEYGIPSDGGQSDNKVKVEVVKGFYFFIPNPAARKKAVLKHDIHHLITQYSSSFQGEVEISAWEIASGCKKYWFGFFIDLSGMMFGLLFDIPGVCRAFVRGRRSYNLYHDTIEDEKALNTPIHELRKLLHVPASDEKIKPTFSDLGALKAAIIIGLIYSFASFILLPPLILYNIWIFVSGQYRR